MCLHKYLIIHIYFQNFPITRINPSFKYISSKNPAVSFSITTSYTYVQFYEQRVQKSPYLPILYLCYTGIVVRVHGARPDHVTSTPEPVCG